MPSSTPTEPHLVYFDANMLVELAMPTSDRASALCVKRVFALFMKHRQDEKLRPVTSLWAIMEAQGAIYQKLLEAKNAALTRPEDPHYLRNKIPPDSGALTDARQKIEVVIRKFEAHSVDAITLEPSFDAEFWRLANHLATEGALQPPDSIHLAIAIVEGCSILFTQDKDFIKKFEYCYMSLSTSFPRLTTINTLKARSVLTWSTFLPRGFPQTLPSAYDELVSLGFVL